MGEFIIKGHELVLDRGLAEISYIYHHTKASQSVELKCQRVRMVPGESV